MTTESVLVFAASGNIGVAAVIGALRTGRSVIAVVRSGKSAETLRATISATPGVNETHLKTVECALTDLKTYKIAVQRAIEASDSEHGFQHVWSSLGAGYVEVPLLDLDAEFMRQFLVENFEPNLLAYRASMPHLLSLPSNLDASFSICTGGAGTTGTRAAPAITQGALFSMANVACRDNETTNVRFNELYLTFRVQVDKTVNPFGLQMLIMSSNEFSKTYQQILEGREKGVKSCRIWAENEGDVETLRFEKKHKG